MTKRWWQSYGCYALLIIACSIAFRLLFFIVFLKDNPCQLMYDAAHYHYPAVSLMHGQGFFVDGSPYFYRMPGYSAFLSGCYRLFGLNLTYALLFQLVVSSCLPLLLFFLVRILYPKQLKAAFIAAAVAVLHPGLLIFSGLVMTEALFLILFVSYLLIFFYFMHSSTKAYWMIIAGVLLGIMSYFRPVGHYVLGYSVLVLLVQQMAWNKKIMRVIGLSAGWIAVILPWLLRNYRLTGYFFLHTLTGPHLMNHMAVRIVMDHDHGEWHYARQVVEQELKGSVALIEARRRRPVLEIEESRCAEQIALKHMWRAPLITIKLLFSNMIKSCASLYGAELLMIDAHGRLPDYQEQRSPLDMIKRFLRPSVNNRWIILALYYELFLGLLLAVGLLYWLVMRWRSKVRDQYTLINVGFVLLFIGLSSICGFARLRLPIEPLIIIYASLGIAHFYFSSSHDDDSHAIISSLVDFQAEQSRF